MLNDTMPALYQESISQKWIKVEDKVENGKKVNLKRAERAVENESRNGSWPSVASPISTSPVPKIHRIPSDLFLTQGSRLLTPSLPPEDKTRPKLMGYLLRLGFGLVQRVLFALARFAWNQIWICPTLWISVWLWLFWKCVSVPVTISKWLLTLTQTWPTNGSRKRTVLISGGSTVQALHLARNFYCAGARVVVCEVEGCFGLARFSTAVTRYYTVPKPEDARALNYVNALCTIVEKENVSYYIPVSATNEAFYDALAKPQLELLNCAVFCPTSKEVSFLDDLFQVLKRCRAVGLATPSYYHITSRDDVLRLYDSGLLGSAKHFMTNVGHAGVSQRIQIQVPPFVQDFRTSLDITHLNPWIVVQDPSGDHYVTCTTVKEALVVGNVTCRLENDRGGMVPVDKQEITAWIQTFFTKIRFRNISGHFCFRFVIPPASHSVVLVGCQMGVSLPYICFTSVHPRIVWKPCKHFTRKSSGPLVVDRAQYWMHDAVLSVLRHPSVEALVKFMGTVLDKREPLFAYWDPLPYCAYYHIQLPFQNLVDFVNGQNRQKGRALTTPRIRDYH